MKIFETERLIIRKLVESDKDIFVELMTDPKITDPAPHQKVDMKNVLEKFQLNLRSNIPPVKNQDNIWAVCTKTNSEMIGIAAILTNDENDWELGYRFKVKNWGQGFGTELAAGIVKFCFDKLNFNNLTADVDITNIASVKILDKIMLPIKEFVNKEDACVDRRYAIEN